MIIPLARISRLTQVIYIEERAASSRFKVSLDPTGRCSVRRGRGTYWSSPIAAVEVGMAALLVLPFCWPAATAGLLLAYWPLRAFGWVPAGPCGSAGGCLLALADQLAGLPTGPYGSAGWLPACSYCKACWGALPFCWAEGCRNGLDSLGWFVAVPANRSAALLGLAGVLACSYCWPAVCLPALASGWRVAYRPLRAGWRFGCLPAATAGGPSERWVVPVTNQGRLYPSQVRAGGNPRPVRQPIMVRTGYSARSHTSLHGSWFGPNCGFLRLEWYLFACWAAHP